MSAFPDGLEPADDLTPARWVESALQDTRGRPLRAFEVNAHDVAGM